MSHLRVVGKPDPSQEKRRSRRASALTPEQERLAKSAVRLLAMNRYGSIVKMSKALGYHGDALRRALAARGRVTGDLLVRVVLVCKVPLDALIAPGPRRVA